MLYSLSCQAKCLKRTSRPHQYFQTGSGDCGNKISCMDQTFSTYRSTVEPFPGGNPETMNDYEALKMGGLKIITQCWKKFPSRITNDWWTECWTERGQDEIGPLLSTPKRLELFSNPCNLLWSCSKQLLARQLQPSNRWFKQPSVTRSILLTYDAFHRSEPSL